MAQRNHLVAAACADSLDLRRRERLNPAWALGLGLAYAALDVHLSSHWGIGCALVLGTAMILGFLQPKQGWLWFPLLSVCLFGIHVLAILCGYRPPYVERSVPRAIGTFVSLGPAFLGVAVGAGLRLVLRLVTATTDPSDAARQCDQLDRFAESASCPWCDETLVPDFFLRQGDGHVRTFLWCPKCQTRGAC
jgi:hypothetical protein